MIKMATRLERENKHVLFTFLDTYLFPAYKNLYWWEGRVAHAHLAYELITRLKDTYSLRLNMDDLADEVINQMDEYRVPNSRREQLLRIMKRF